MHTGLAVVHWVCEVQADPYWPDVGALGYIHVRCVQLVWTEQASHARPKTPQKLVVVPVWQPCA